MADERREMCKTHNERTDYLDKVVWKGNGEKSLLSRVIKLEVMMWVLILLVLGNGGLLAYSLNILSKVAK